MELSSHSLVLLQQLNVQREFGFLCDCTVAIGNVYFKAHRAVLAAFSNYFKMIFIHQSSECIKIQPSDIQPDVFSFLLHIMYTGSCPQTPVDGTRLQEGIRFLHAYTLCRKAGDAEADTLRMSNLYGIQISSQLTGKDGNTVSKAAGASSAEEGGRSPGQGGRSLGVEGVASEVLSTTLRTVCSGASVEDTDVPVCVKQEQVEEEAEGAGPLFSHALNPHSAELDTGMENDGVGPESLEAGCLEEALRRSQALANQLAAELRRSRGGGAGSGDALSSRKRKIACAVCSVRFTHKTQLQEHMYQHTGKPRLHRYGRLCPLPGPAHLCEGGVSSGASASLSEDAHRDNGSSCYSLDSEVSQESGDGLPVE
ncbi:LOW QUALITY PROTEIN: zinc finger and BTB domain-containing protein 25 [Gouania willdenowi]|uniref:LOW QUALITY PROTEIN: zinc finger and BTB domain-containing protein 25 n=1 Tax=Gouania willdenowi TaxID=441366 RepID=UPI00105534C1|nr:LOW QUALITY PROTEIN: zinc finger and BTB domain-containing protein 25 [Gouania willdenowi]